MRIGVRNTAMLLLSPRRCALWLALMAHLPSYW
jgi:hypothetical protein